MPSQIGQANRNTTKYPCRLQNPDQLILYNRPYRQHPKRQLKKLHKAIKQFGFVVPIIVDQRSHVLDGCARLLVAREMGLELVPTIVVDGLEPHEVKALSLALNRLAEEAEWERDAVADTLSSIIEIDADFDIQLSGFDVAEVDQLILETETRGTLDEIDQDIPAPPDRPVSREGDVYQLGRHRITCGNCFDPRCREFLLTTKAQLVCLDPPFNVRISGHATGAGRIRHRDFPMASGEMSPEEFTRFLEDSLRAHVDAVEDGALAYVFIDWRHVTELQAAARSLSLTPINLCVWVKKNGGMGSLYRSRHELIFIFRKGDTQHRNNVQLGRFGRNRTNVWEYEGASALTPARRAQLEMHPTVKPVPLIEDILLDCTKRGDIVLDGFLGSGTALLAAERTGRTCHGVELDPGYIDLIIDRWQRLTGQEAVHEATGFTFRELRARRHRVRPPAKAA